VPRSGSDRRDAERGSATITTLVAFGLFLTFFTLFAQFAVWQYGRGAVRSAALEAARAAAPMEAVPGACERRFDDVTNGLLGGPLGDQVSPPVCDVGTDLVVVSADVRFEPWLPISPEWSFTVTATAVREVEPE
jgi:hypothetical protein